METSLVEVFPVENMTTGNFLEAGMNSWTGQQTNRPKQRQRIHWEQNQRSDPTGLEYKNTAAILGHLANHETQHVIHSVESGTETHTAKTN